LSAVAGKLFEGPGVELLQEGTNALVELAQ
jgi:hypothetical protein